MKAVLALTAILASVASAVAGGETMREVRSGEYTVRLDLTGQVLGLLAPQDIAFGERGREVEVPLHASLAEIADDDFVSASVLAAKAKQFDDGLFAAAELAAQTGLGDFAGKEKLLATLAKQLASGAPNKSIGILYAGAELGGVKVDVPAPYRALVETQKKEFLGDALHSKPIGFYTWSRELSAIFQQDRMLQSELPDPAGTEAIVRALAANKEVLANYTSVLNLAEQLTNSFRDSDLRDLVASSRIGKLRIPDRGVRFFPPSVAPETELVMLLFEGKPIPEGFNLADELVRRVQAGTLTLRPAANAGWYAQQLYSYESLVVPERSPEAARLRFDNRYKEHLIALFKGLITLTRESHVKQLEMPGHVGAAPPSPEPEVVINVSPALSTEPLATHYLRRSHAYAFVRHVLENAFGRVALSSMHRRTAVGPASKNLAEELAEMEALFYDAHVAVTSALGMQALEKSGSGSGPAVSETRFAEFRQQLATDPDLGQDVRTMVPVFYDIGRKQTKVWVVLGWATRPVAVTFEHAPRVAVILKAGKPVSSGVRVEFRGDCHEVAYPVTAEVYVSKILNRDEFRKLCDTYKTQKAILANLK